MTNQQGALQYADRDHMDLGSYYLRHVSAMTGEALHSKSAIAAELAHRDREIDRLQAENANLNAGYAAARLEVESLQARIKTMAEEHADELMVAHMDGRMRAAQPAGAQQPGDCGNTPYDEGPFTLAQQPDTAYADLMQAASDWICEHVDNGTPGVMIWAIRLQSAAQKLRASHGQAPAQAAPAAVEGCTRSHPHENMDSACRAKAAIAEMQNMAARGAEATAHDLDRFVAMLAAAPTPPAHAADSVLEDAARLEFEMQHGSAIAAARKQGANHD